MACSHDMTVHLSFLARPRLVHGDEGFSCLEQSQRLDQRPNPRNWRNCGWCKLAVLELRQIPGGLLLVARRCRGTNREVNIALAHQRGSGAWVKILGEQKYLRGATPRASVDPWGRRVPEGSCSRATIRGEVKSWTDLRGARASEKRTSP